MEHKVKLIESNYNSETGVSYAIIETDLGNFRGKAKLHPEDAAIASSFAGCQYAERRAVLKYLAKKQKILTKELDLIKNEISVIEEGLEKAMTERPMQVADIQNRRQSN